MALTAGLRLLNGRYELIRSMISKAGEGKLWGATSSPCAASASDRYDELGRLQPAI